MQVFKFGNDLAVRLPRILVTALKLAPGDQLNVVDASRGQLAVEKIDKRAEFLRMVEQFRFPLPEGYRFDRDEASAR